MRSISEMPSSDLAGGAKRRVPLPVRNAFLRLGRWRSATRADTLKGGTKPCENAKGKSQTL